MGRKFSSSICVSKNTTFSSIYFDSYKPYQLHVLNKEPLKISKNTIEFVGAYVRWYICEFYNAEYERAYQNS